MGTAETYSHGGRLVIERPFVLVLAVIVVVLLGGLLRGLTTGQTQFADIGTLAWDGLMQGLVIGFTGVGLSMTYSILNFANLSHGDYITAGALPGWAMTYLTVGLGRAGIGALLLVGVGGSVYGGTLDIGVFSAPLAVVAGIAVSDGFAIALSFAVDRAVFKPVRNENGITPLIMSASVVFAFRYLVQLVFGSDMRGTTAQPPSLPLDFIDDTVFISAHDITFLVVVSALMFGVHTSLQRMKLGKAIHTMADNKDLALITGILTECVVRTTWIVGGGLTDVTGHISILRKGTLGFDDGWLLLSLAFAAVTLDGIGSIYGAIAGSLAAGLTASMLVLWTPSASSRVAAFAVVIVTLLVKLSGLSNGRATV